MSVSGNLSLTVFPGIQGLTMADLRPGEQGVVNSINGDVSLKRRLSALGFVRGVAVGVCHTAPLGDPRVYSVLGYQLSLRNVEARKILLRRET